MLHNPLLLGNTAVISYVRAEEQLLQLLAFDLVFQPRNWGNYEKNKCPDAAAHATDCVQHVAAQGVTSEIKTETNTVTYDLSTFLCVL